MLYKETKNSKIIKTEISLNDLQNRLIILY
jgi:hypothetical protein